MAAAMSGDGGGRVRFFCTAGRGMERFVAAELIEKAAAVEVESEAGKVFFSANPDWDTLKNVKSAERMFLLLMRGPPISLSRNKGALSGQLQKAIIGDPSIWLEAVATWRHLQKALPQKECLPEKGRGQKRKSDPHPEMVKTKISRKGFPEEKDMACCEETKDVEEPQHLQPLRDEEITFRVSCRCSGGNTRNTSAQEVGCIIGLSLTKLFGWKPDLRSPELEVFVHINDMYSVVGFPIGRRPLASRNYIQNTGLRSTTAWAMASLAEISTSSCVLDPMCGVGTILLEAAKEWPNASYLGIDISDSQLKSALGNVETAGVSQSVAFLKGSVLGLPILSESIDAVISDVPFGKKFTCSKDMKELLPDIIREMERVLRVGGVLVLLLSQNLHYHLKKNIYFKPGKVVGKPTHGKDEIQCQDESLKKTKDLSQHTHCFTSLVHLESHSDGSTRRAGISIRCGMKTSKNRRQTEAGLLLYVDALSWAMVR